MIVRSGDAESRASNSTCVHPALPAALSAAQPSITPNNSTQFDGLFPPFESLTLIGRGLSRATLPFVPRSQPGKTPKRDDLLCFWFSGTGEGQSNVAIVMARLTAGSRQWSNANEIDHLAGRSFQNPVAFQLPGGRLWLLHTSQAAGRGQSNAEVLYLTSDDLGRTWTAPQVLFNQPGSFVRQPPVLIDSHNLQAAPDYVPTLAASITEGAEADYSAVQKTADGGRVWKRVQNSAIEQSRAADGIVRLAPPERVSRAVPKPLRRFHSPEHFKTNGCDWTDTRPHSSSQ